MQVCTVVIQETTLLVQQPLLRRYIFSEYHKHFMLIIDKSYLQEGTWDTSTRHRHANNPTLMYYTL